MTINLSHFSEKLPVFPVSTAHPSSSNREYDEHEFADMTTLTN
jgi:hypothetical protein